MNNNKNPIPKYCKANCKYRDKKATQNPACQYNSQLVIEQENNVLICKAYKKEGIK